VRKPDKLARAIGGPARAIGDLFPEVLAGVGAGLAAGLWATHVHKELNDVATILVALGGADAAILALVLAAVGLMANFIRGFFGEVIEHARGGLRGFFRPFLVVAATSSLGVICSFGGAIDAERGSKEARAVWFGLALGFSAWAVVGTYFLVLAFIRRTIEGRNELLRDDGDSNLF